MVEIGAPSMARAAAARRAARSSSIVQAPLCDRRRGRDRARPDPLDQALDAAPQLGGRAIGEGHDQHLVEARVAADQPIDDQVLDEERLAGARRRLDDGRPIARDSRQLVGKRIEDRRGAHRRFFLGGAVGTTEAAK